MSNRVTHRIIKTDNGSIFRTHEKTCGFIVSIHGRLTIIRDWWDIVNLYTCKVDFANAKIDINKNKFITNSDNLPSVDVRAYWRLIGKDNTELYKTYKIMKKLIMDAGKSWDNSVIQFHGIEQYSKSLKASFRKIKGNTSQVDEVYFSLMSDANEEDNKNLVQYIARGGDFKVLNHWSYPKVKEGLEIAIHCATSIEY